MMVGAVAVVTGIAGFVGTELAKQLLSKVSELSIMAGFVGLPGLVCGGICPSRQWWWLARQPEKG
jgi:hypothetical protein